MTNQEFYNTVLKNLENHFTYKMQSLKDESAINQALKNAQSEQEIFNIAKIDFVLSLNKIQDPILKNFL